MKSFKKYLKERFAKKGFKYEARIQIGLYNAGFADTNKTAGSSNRADALFLYKGKEHNLEIGTKGKDYAQGMVYWDVKRSKWYASTKNSESLTKYLEKWSYDDDLMDKWGALALGAKQAATPKQKVAAARRGDLILTGMPPRMIWDYYKDKETYYIQVENYGAFWMKKNPLRLPLPRFEVTPELRFRVKGYGSSAKKTHDTTWAIKIPDMISSPYTFDVEDTTRKGPAEFLK